MNTTWNYQKHFRRVLNLSFSMNYIDKNPYSKFKARFIFKLVQTGKNGLSSTAQKQTIHAGFQFYRKPERY